MPRTAHFRKMLYFALLGCLQAYPETPQPPAIVNTEVPQSEHNLNIEIERKFEVTDPAALAAFLTPLTALHTKREVDVYLDTPDATLIKRGIWIRVRNGKQLDFKFNQACLDDPTLELQNYCEEHTFKVPLTDEDTPRLNELNKRLGLESTKSTDFEAYLAANSFIEHRTVDKTRTTYKKGEFTLVVDVIAGLGSFLEIELMASNTQDIGAIVERMMAALSGLPLKRVKTSYDSLILRKQNFAQYLQSRFVLEEDKAAQPEIKSTLV